MGGDIWSLVLIGGPIVLLAVIVWAWLRNRNAPASTITRAEHGAEALRDDIEEGVPPPKR
jgi:hypothetical protein